MDPPGKLWSGKAEVRHLRQPNSMLLADESGSTVADDHRNSNSTSPKINDRLDQETSEPLQVSNPSPNNSEQRATIAATSTLSANASEFIPGRSLAGVRTGENSSHSQRPSCKDEQDVEIFKGSSDDNRLQHVLNTLVKDPGQFDDLLQLILDTLKPHFNSVYIMQYIAQLIVNMATSECNFCYTGAKLCCVIGRRYGEFFATLCEILHAQLCMGNVFPGTILFLSELYVKSIDYEYDMPNDFGELLLRMSEGALTYGDSSIIKAVCQCLKLAGQHLEQYNPDYLDEIIGMLYAKRDMDDSSLSSLIECVCNLRKDFWGISEPTCKSVFSNNGYADHDDTPLETDQPSFYMEDGAECSKEESEFLAANLQLADEYAASHSDASNDPDDVYSSDPEMTAEIRAGFEEFLKLQK